MTMFASKFSIKWILKFTLVAISDLAKQFEALKYLFESINLELVKWLDNLMHFLQGPLSRSFLFDW